MACLNPHSVIVAEKDALFHEALQSADILLPDGAGVVLAAKVLRNPINERVAGFEFFTAMSRALAVTGKKRIFFLGSTDEVLAKILARFVREYPMLTICGMYSPPFKSEFTEAENKIIIDRINEAGADVLWVGMTAPKQEKWIYQHIDRLSVSFVGAIGAVFDFYAGTRSRAPVWVCNMGLEWLPRLLEDPKRLWRRNLVSTPLFLLKLGREAFFR
jgi:N-acetylglucosaminyldiphosphoundecaprenol N-acetyl-beta-D-mannosaminyltransferase